MRFLLALITSLAAHAESGHLAVVNKASGSVSILEMPSGKPITTVQTGYLPHEVAVSPDANELVISNYGKDHVRSQKPTNRPGRSITFLGLKSQVPPFELDLGNPNCAPHGLAYSPDGGYLYVTCENRDQVAVVNLKTKTVEASIPTGQSQSHMIVLSPDGGTGYVSNFSAGSVTQLNLRERTTGPILVLGQGVEGIGISHDGKFLYATSVLESKVFKIDARTLTVVKEAPTERSPIRVIPTSDDKELVVPSSATDQLLILDAETLSTLRTVKIGRQPIGVVVTPRDKAFVASMLANEISLVDLKSGRVEQVFPSGGDKPDGLTYIQP